MWDFLTVCCLEDIILSNVKGNEAITILYLLVLNVTESSTAWDTCVSIVGPNDYVSLVMIRMP